MLASRLLTDARALRELAAWLRDPGGTAWPSGHPAFLVALALRQHPPGRARELAAKDLDWRADLFEGASNEPPAFRLVFCDLLLGGHPLHEAYLTAGDVSRPA